MTTCNDILFENGSRTANDCDRMLATYHGVTWNPRTIGGAFYVRMQRRGTKTLLR